MYLTIFSSFSAPWSQFPWVGKNAAEPYGSSSQYNLPMASRTQPTDASMVSAFSSGVPTGSSIGSNPYALSSQSFSRSHSTSQYASPLSMSSPNVGETSVTSAGLTAPQSSLKSSVLGMAWSQFPWMGKTPGDTYGPVPPQYGLTAPQKSLGIDSSQIQPEIPTSQADINSSYAFPQQEGLSTQYLSAAHQLSTQINPSPSSLHFNPSDASGLVGTSAPSTMTSSKPFSSTTEFLSPLSSAINPLASAGHASSHQGSSPSNYSELIARLMHDFQ